MERLVQTYNLWKRREIAKPGAEWDVNHSSPLEEPGKPKQQELNLTVGASKRSEGKIARYKKRSPATNIYVETKD